MQLQVLEQLEVLPETPDVQALVTRAATALQQVREQIQCAQQQQQLLLEQQEIATATAAFSSRMFGDPLGFMQPTISSDPELAAVFGSSSTRATFSNNQHPSHAVAALMGWLDYRCNKIVRDLRGSDAGPAGCNTGPSAADQQQQRPAAHEPAGKQKGGKTSTSSKKDCKAASDFLSLEDFLKYYTEVSSWSAVSQQVCQMYSTSSCTGLRT